MRILMLSGAYPIPTDNGSKRRILATATHLSQRHDLTMFSLRETYPSKVISSERHEVPWRDHVIDIPFKSRLRTALYTCLSRHPYARVKYWNNHFKSAVEKMLTAQHFDCIWINFLNMVSYIERYYFKIQSIREQPPPIFILDQHNVDELYFRSFLTSKVNIAYKLFATLEMLKARRLQRRWFPRFDAMLCVSQDDLQKTVSYVDGRTDVWLAPNGVDIEYFQPVAQQELKKQAPIIVFGGSLDVTMNQDAVLWFSDNILPSIKQQVPDTQFWVVGRNPPSEIRNLDKRQGVLITGTVSDVRDYYSQAAVFVVPLRVGGGTKLKTLEAMSMGLPIVSTTVGAQGLNVESGRHIYRADRPEDFIAHTVELLKDRYKANRMGAEARLLVGKKYSWTSIMNDIDYKLTNLYLSKQQKTQS